MPEETVPFAAGVEHIPFPLVHTLCPDSARMMPFTSSVPALVEVPVPEIYWFPWMVRVAFGEDVPIPTLPFASTMSAVDVANAAVDVPIQNKGCVPPGVPATARRACDVVPTPREPLMVDVPVVLVAVKVENDGLDVPVRRVPSKETRDEFEKAVLFVPPFAIERAEPRARVLM